jgi:hypothetical protein
LGLPTNMPSRGHALETRGCTGSPRDPHTASMPTGLPSSPGRRTWLPAQAASPTQESQRRRGINKDNDGYRSAARGSTRRVC